MLWRSLGGFGSQALAVKPVIPDSQQPPAEQYAEPKPAEQAERSRAGARHAVLGPAAKGRTTRKVYVLKVKSAGGMASMSQQCKKI